jgi:hypothetical protein
MLILSLIKVIQNDKKMIKIKFLPIFLALSFSCVTNNSSKDLTTKSTYTIDSLKVKIDSSIHQTYSLFSVDNRTDQTYFYGMNFHTNYIDVLDLKTIKFLKPINFFTEGPNAINRVGSFYVHNRDSIFVFESFGTLSLLNQLGEKQVLFNLTNRKEYDYGMILATNNVPLKYCKERNSFLFVIRVDSKDAKEDDRLLVEFNLKTNEFKELPIYYSKKYFEMKKKIGLMCDFRVGYYDKFRIVYNFGFDDNLYEYEFETEKVICHESPKKTNVLKARSTKDMQSLLRTAGASDINMALVVDKKNEVIYKPVWNGIKVKANEDIQKVFWKKGVTIQVYDLEFNYKTSFDLPKNKYAATLFFSDNKGLCAFPFHPANETVYEDEFVYHRFRL